MAKVLLVEDDNNLREIYEARLQAEGYEISSAQDGEQALVVAKQFKPDLIISDVMMPKISGFEMLDILRNTEGLQQTRVIMLTALGQAEDKSRADSLGADRYLVKSQVTLEDIVKAAHEILDDSSALPPAVVAAAVEPAASIASPATPAPDPTPAADSPAAEPSPAADPPTADSGPADTPQAAGDPIATAALINPVDQTTTDEPTEAAPTATDPPTEDAAAGTSQADAPPGSAATEQADVNQQIEEFISKTDDQPIAVEPEPAAETAEAPPATPETTAVESDQSADDKLMAEAAENLSAGTDQPTVIQPSPQSTPLSDDAAQTEKPAAPSQTEAVNDGVTIAHKKIIQPLETDSKPDINELLAKEEGRDAMAEAAAIVTSEPAPEPVEDIAPPPALAHQPGDAFTPQVEPSPPEDTPAGAPPQAKPTTDFDPNNIAI